MRALTGFLLSASIFILLHASSGHSGYTSLVKTNHFPSRDTVASAASVERLVICFGSLPSAAIVQICDDPPRFDTNAMRFESGIQRGRWLVVPSCVTCTGTPPATGTT